MLSFLFISIINYYFVTLDEPEIIIERHISPDTLKETYSKSYCFCVFYRNWKKKAKLFKFYAKLYVKQELKNKKLQKETKNHSWTNGQMI